MLRSFDITHFLWWILLSVGMASSSGSSMVAISLV